MYIRNRGIIEKLSTTLLTLYKMSLKRLIVLTFLPCLEGVNNIYGQ